jgi:hypothetical protein
VVVTIAAALAAAIAAPAARLAVAASADTKL